MKKKNLEINDFDGSIVWSYTRVSTKEQFIKNGSIENQVKTIKRFANQYNLQITEEFDAEYESSKRINTQNTLRELTEKLRKTNINKRPKIILIWSPSRFGRAGAEHIQLFVNLRKNFGVYLYSVSTDHNTFNERSENEFSSQLLYAQRENFNRQDTIIPGLINALESGKYIGKCPRGYDHFGPRVKDPDKVQAKQEIILNKEGKILKEAFHLKIYKHYSDKDVLDFLERKGIRLAYQSLNNIWRTKFYTGFIHNSLLNKPVKGNWEPIITLREYEILNEKISNSSKNGIIKIKGNIETPLTPKFLVCDDCDTFMTSYQNKKKKIFYYKCNCCNKTVNTNTTQKSKYIGLNNIFEDDIKNLQIDESLEKIILKQIEILTSSVQESNSQKRRELKLNENKLAESLDLMEYRFAIGELSKEIFERQGQKIKDEIKKNQIELVKIPDKKSNQNNYSKFIKSISANPIAFYKNLSLENKKIFQKTLFPVGWRYSIENRENRTKTTSSLYNIISSISKSYDIKNKKTQDKFVPESHTVPWVGIEPTLRRTRV